MKNTMADLRNHLFETLEALKDKDQPMDVDRAKAVCNVAQKLIETAKVEVKFIEVTGKENNADFFKERKPQLANGRALTNVTTPAK